MPNQNLMSSLMTDPNALADIVEGISQNGGYSTGPTAGGGIPIPQKPKLQVPQIAQPTPPPAQPDHKGFGSTIGNIFRTLSGAKLGETLRQQHVDLKMADAIITRGIESGDPSLIEQGMEMAAKHGGKPAKDFILEMRRRAELHAAKNQPQVDVPNLAAPPSVGGFDEGRIGFTPEQTGRRLGEMEAAKALSGSKFSDQIFMAKLARLKTLLPPGAFEKLDPQQISDYIATEKIPYAPVHAAAEGTTLFGPNGQVVGQGQPRPMTVGPGQRIVVPPSGQPAQPLSGSLGRFQIGASPTPPPGTSPEQWKVVAEGGAEQMNPAEAKLLSVAQQVAERHKLPFDPNKNPSNPFAQIPTRYHQEIRALDAEQSMDPAMRASILAQRAAIEGTRDAQKQNMLNQRADQSYRVEVRRLDAMRKPIDDQSMRLGRLISTVNQGTPQADALIAPELLTVMAGGQGSGLRMNEAEIARIVGGRNHWQDIKSAIMRWQIDPSKPFSVTPEQRQQIWKLIGEVKGRLDQKQKLIDDASDELVGADSPESHRKLVAELRKSLTAIDAGQQVGAMPPVPPGKIIVKDKRDGQTGMIDEKDFNAATMEKVGGR